MISLILSRVNVSHCDAIVVVLAGHALLGFIDFPEEGLERFGAIVSLLDFFAWVFAEVITIVFLFVLCVVLLLVFEF